jgi:sugar/nucleoside kinase (ribokinase family)
MPPLYDVAAIGNAIVDVIAPASDAFLEGEGLAKGGMTLIDEARAHALYGAMAPGLEASGGSAANTIAGVASFGGRSVFLGKVAADPLGEIFGHDMRAIGAHFATRPLAGGAATGRCLVNVSPDGERTMSTFLGAAQEISAADIDPAVIEAAATLYLEGYLFTSAPARGAFARAAALARGSGAAIALSLSDAFIAEHHREDLLAFIDRGVDVLFANELEVKTLFRAGDFEAAVSALRGRVKIAAITRGAAGSLILGEEGDHVIPADPVEKVVDTTGAGDQYAAGFLYGLGAGRALAVCGRLGALAAGEVIAHYGPRPAVSLAALAAAKGL